MFMGVKRQKFTLCSRYVRFSLTFTLKIVIMYVWREQNCIGCKSISAYSKVVVTTNGGQGLRLLLISNEP